MLLSIVGKKLVIQPGIKLAPNFFSFKGSLKTDRAFDIDAMDWAVEQDVAEEYTQKRTGSRPRRSVMRKKP